MTFTGMPPIVSGIITVPAEPLYFVIVPVEELKSKSVSGLGVFLLWLTVSVSSWDIGIVDFSFVANVPWINTLKDIITTKQQADTFNKTFFLIYYLSSLCRLYSVYLNYKSLCKCWVLMRLYTTFVNIEFIIVNF